MKESLKESLPAYVGAAVIACAGLSGCVFYLNPLCNDQIRNGDETDVDCGGTCGLCNIGDSCRRDTDCDESTCDGGTCTPLPCANGILDPGETDVDCGGAVCSKCSGGRACVTAGDCFSGACTLGANTCDELATVAFAGEVSYPSGAKSYAVFSGDLNGDGHLDLVAANELDSSLSVFLNDGTGAFQSVASLGTAHPTGAYPTGGAIADLNHDGIADVLTANYHGNSVSVLFGVGSAMTPGKGTGGLISVVSYPTTDNAETSNLALGDLNGDGNLDVIAANPGVLVPEAASVSQLLGRADGTFAPAITTPVGIAGGSQPFSVAIDDFDGNGTSDVAIADVLNGPTIVKLGNGDGTFQAETLYAVGGTGPHFIVAHDMNLDGRPDLVCANRNSNDVSVLLGRGDGTFRNRIITGTGPTTGPYALAVADFNRDGVPDVVTANSTTNNSTVLLGIGNGHFEAPIDTGATGNLPYGIAVGDFNGDGKPDFATANAVSNDVTVKLSTAN